MKSQTTIDPYKVLGVRKDASEAEIKETYRNLMKENHPDVHPDEKKKKDAENRAKDINVAYDLLSDPEKRAAYDNPAPQFNGANLNDIVNHMFGGRVGGMPGGFFDFGGFSNPNIVFQQTLRQSIDVDVFTLILGGEIGVILPDGKEKKITIPPDTSANARFQLKLDKNITIILVPNVVIPKLTEEQRKKLREIFKKD
jgi:curved DNA-binding protein